MLRDGGYGGVEERKVEGMVFVVLRDSSTFDAVDGVEVHEFAGTDLCL